MDADWVKEDETLEDLQLKELKVIQKKDGFRFGMDSVLLAHFARIGERDHVADFGTGSGVIPLLLIGRNKGRTFECFEIQEEIAEMAERTMRMNGLSDRVHILHEDAAKAFEHLEGCSMDAVICNPPYGIPGTALSSPYNSRCSRPSPFSKHSLFISRRLPIPCLCPPPSRSSPPRLPYRKKLSPRRSPPRNPAK